LTIAKEKKKPGPEKKGGRKAQTLRDATYNVEGGDIVTQVTTESRWKVTTREEGRRSNETRIVSNSSGPTQCLAKSLAGKRRAYIF